MQVFKKGSVVPRRLGIFLTQLRGAQHHIRFGMDVTFDGHELRPAHKMGKTDSLIVIKGDMAMPRKNGTRQKSGGYLVSGWQVTSPQEPGKESYSAVITRAQAD